MTVHKDPYAPNISRANIPVQPGDTDCKVYDIHEQALTTVYSICMVQRVAPPKAQRVSAASSASAPFLSPFDLNVSVR